MGAEGSTSKSALKSGPSSSALAECQSTATLGVLPFPCAHAAIGDAATTLPMKSCRLIQSPRRSRSFRLPQSAPMRIAYLSNI
jgi:hypothetical protein